MNTLKTIENIHEKFPDFDTGTILQIVKCIEEDAPNPRLDNDYWRTNLFPSGKK